MEVGEGLSFSPLPFPSPLMDAHLCLASERLLEGWNLGSLPLPFPSPLRLRKFPR